MIVILFIVSAIFLLIGLAINPTNAPYLLTDLKLFSLEKQSDFALLPYIKFFKQSHVFLASSTFFVGLFLHFIFPGDGAMYWLVFYPLVFYSYVLWRSQKFYALGHKKPVTIYMGLGVLLFSIIGIAGGLYYINRPNTIVITHKQIEITGVYGGTLLREKTETKQVDRLPKLIRRVNGVATQRLKKGYFLTAKKRKVKVFVTDTSGTFILFCQKGDTPIYYQLQKEKTVEIIDLLKEKGWFSKI